MIPFIRLEPTQHNRLDWHYPISKKEKSGEKNCTGRFECELGDVHVFELYV